MTVAVYEKTDRGAVIQSTSRFWFSRMETCDDDDDDGDKRNFVWVRNGRYDEYRSAIQLCMYSAYSSLDLQIFHRNDIQTGHTTSHTHTHQNHLHVNMINI